MRPLKDLVKFGNNKIDSNTAIFNMTTATNCPSKALGMCKVCNQYGDGGCYALRPEQFRSAVKPYREEQRKYWLSNTANDIYEDFARILDRKRKIPKYFRFNEAGDFISQSCVDKLSIVAHCLKKHFDITTFGYTARKDLAFNFVSFLVKSSGYFNGNNGRTIVVEKGDDIPAGYKVCPAPNDCMADGFCNLCATKCDIAFIKH